jgi:phage-related protein
MALGFATTATYGSRQILPDKGMTRQTQPRVLLAQFGDGYEQRIANGINSLQESYSVSFNNRTKEEIDDITGYLGSLQGVTALSFTIPDSNNSGETTIKVICDSFSQSYSYDDFYSASATFRRVYEA